MMKLKGFQITQFRSVVDSGWIEADDVTALIGTNEAGKTNILLPLWKLNPAKEGEIVPTADFPRKQYNNFRTMKEKPVFVRARFEADDKLLKALAAASGMAEGVLKTIEVSRNLDGKHKVDFPDASPPKTVSTDRVLDVIKRLEQDVGAMSAETEAELKTVVLSTASAARSGMALKGELDAEGLGKVLKVLEGVKLDDATDSSVVAARQRAAIEQMKSLATEVGKKHPRDDKAVTDLVLKSLPKFVYYSNYGNLDSEIYLPHVIANLKRPDLGQKEQAKARTLKVLFEFVKLQPEEILELGRDFQDRTRQPTDAEIESIALKKKQRSILLQSASTLLTTEFREWWKQGEYRFRFEADGDHFRIWVSDDKRPEEIELEGRSTGLQWFLSFYLVFLVERVDAHEGSILLLDEPGLSLHPLSQRDLSVFFDGLSKANQLLYTCHSPFLVDADRLDRARKVYVGDDGTSKVTPDLGAHSPAQRGASYAVHAALGLTVAESLLLGCTPIIVEGVSDQHYLTAIKILLIASGRLKPGRELVFPPAKGAKGVKAVSSILGGRDGVLPVVLLDADAEGLQTAKSLREGLYATQEHLVLEMGTFVQMPDAEVEDLFPPKIIAEAVDKWQRGPEVAFGAGLKKGQPIVPQIEAWASSHGITLESPAWKVELAKRVKQQLLTNGPDEVDAGVLDEWAKLFAAFEKAAEVEAEVLPTLKRKERKAPATT